MRAGGVDALVRGKVAVLGVLLVGDRVPGLIVTAGDVDQTQLAVFTCNVV